METDTMPPSLPRSSARPLSALPGLALLAFLGSAPLALPAAAAPCSTDVVPAASLLVPYFEVDFEAPDSANTIVSVRNTSTEPALVQVTLWTDWAAASITFSLFLTGLDTVEIDFYEMFALGNLPVTADEQTDPDDTISPHVFPEWDGSFPDCGFFFPFPEPVLVGSILDRLRGAHTGTPIGSLGDQCLGGVQADGRARGYVTIDNVGRCNLLFPWEPGYFDAGGAGVAIDANRLTGSLRLLDPFSGGDTTLPAVHLEADPSLPGTTGATFYGRFFGWDGRDHREPLETVWTAAFEAPPPISRPPAPIDGTELLVWRDPTDAEVLTEGAECGVGPGWLNLGQRQVACVDPGGGLSVVCSGSDCLPAAVQRVFVGGGGLGVSLESGSCRLDLNAGCPDCTPGGLGLDGIVAQSYVASLTTRPTPPSSSALPGTGLASACDEAPATLDLGEVFADGFESGDLSAWGV